jgi:hypothetical protein
VHIRTDLGAGDCFFVGEDLLLKGLCKFNVMRLRRAATVAKLLWTWISGLAVGASPLKLYVAKLFLSHRSLFPLDRVILSDSEQSEAENSRFITGMQSSYARGAAFPLAGISQFG